MCLIQNAYKTATYPPYSLKATNLIKGEEEVLQMEYHQTEVCIGLLPSRRGLFANLFLFQSFESECDP